MADVARAKRLAELRDWAQSGRREFLTGPH